MIGHTAFLVTARRLAPGVIAPPRQRRPTAHLIRRRVRPPRWPSLARTTWMQSPGHSLAEAITSSRKAAGTSARAPGLQRAARRPRP